MACGDGRRGDVFLDHDWQSQYQIHYSGFHLQRAVLCGDDPLVRRSSFSKNGTGVSCPVDRKLWSDVAQRPVKEEAVLLKEIKANYLGRLERLRLTLYITALL